VVKNGKWLINFGQNISIQFKKKCTIDRLWSFVTRKHVEGELWVMIYLTAIGLPPGGSSRVHIYKQTVHTRVG
jgi:hypothetical protein